MSIRVDAANVNYKNLRYTKKGNQYQKSNAGKLVGTLGMAAIPVVGFLKNKEMLKNAFNTSLQNAKEAIKQQNLSVSSEEVGSALKSGVLAGGAAVVAGYALAGLGIGALVDFAVNKFKAYKADKEKTGVIV